MLKVKELIRPAFCSRRKKVRRGEAVARRKQRHRDRTINIRIAEQIKTVRSGTRLVSATIRAAVEGVAASRTAINRVSPAEAAKDVIAGTGRFIGAAAKDVRIFEVCYEVVNKPERNLIHFQTRQISDIVVQEIVQRF